MTLKRLLRIRSDERGAGAVEFALAVPVLASMLYGFFTVGILYQANAGMQHALGEAARLATIFRPATNGPPPDTEIQAMITNSDFSLPGGTLTPTINNNQLAAGYKTITLTYTRPTEFLFFDGPTITLVRSKRVYIAPPTTLPNCATPGAGAGGGTCVVAF
jgi:Flp pilus assembly protein TadG